MDLYKYLHERVLNNLAKAGIHEYYSHYLISENIDDSSVIIDLGANEGKFYSLLNTKYDCISYIVEASTLLFEKLPIVGRIIPFHYAISNKEGPINFFLSNNQEANSLHSDIASIGGEIKSTLVEGITFENFLRIACIDSKIEVLKIDIEGAELDVFENISSITLSQISQIAVEFHDFIIQTKNYLNSMKSAIKKLRNNNFLVVKISEADWREVLFINKKNQIFDLKQQIRIIIIHPFLQFLMSLYRKAGKIKNVASQN